MSESKPKSWLQRIGAGLATSSKSFGLEQIFDGFGGGKLSAEQCEELEDQLIMADLGPDMAARLAKTFSTKSFKANHGEDIVELAKTHLAGEIAEILKPASMPLDFEQPEGPFVVLMVGVNGSGKTTTIGKLSQMWMAAGKRVCVAAGDTFRAAAVEQLKSWADRSGAGFISAETGSDPAALAFAATQKALKDNVDILLIDTAGRLQNRSGLIDELKKIHRVIGKAMPGAPHATLLTLDGTTGQNAKEQVRIFGEAVEVSGLVLTKLDGSARGGIVVALANDYKLPIPYIGFGEAAEDLGPFDATAFARGLVGLPPEVEG